MKSGERMCLQLIGVIVENVLDAHFVFSARYMHVECKPNHFIIYLNTYISMRGSAHTNMIFEMDTTRNVTS